MAEEGETPEPDEKEIESEPAGVVIKPAEKSEADDLSELEERPFEVRLNSYKLVSALGVTAVHNEIAFYDSNNKPIISFNGNAYNNLTGEFKHFATSQDHTLRVNGSQETLEKTGMPLAGSVTLGKLTRDELAEKLETVVAASNFINDNKIQYVVVGGPNYEAQNSNSVASSLTHALGYEYPEAEFAQLWAPGYKRNLLPDDWSHDKRPFAELEKDAQRLSGSEVKKAVEEEHNTPIVTPEGQNYFPTFFKPNETTVFYVKKGEEIEMRGTDVADAAPEETPEETPEEISEEDNKSLSVGFQSSAEIVIQTDQNLTKSFSTAAANRPPQPAPDQGVEITNPTLHTQVAQNSASYLSTGTNGP